MHMKDLNEELSQVVDLIEQSCSAEKIRAPWKGKHFRLVECFCRRHHGSESLVYELANDTEIEVLKVGG